MLFDIKVVLLGEGLIVYLIVKELMDKKLIIEEIYEFVSKLVFMVVYWFIVDDIFYLVWGGCVLKVVGFIVMVVNIKFILYVLDEGKFILCYKVIGCKCVVKGLFEEM